MCTGYVVHQESIGSNGIEGITSNGNKDQQQWSVVEKRDALKAWTILLAILAFGFSLIGTFIVRSGVLTSVHAFANDPERGVFILMIH